MVAKTKNSVNAAIIGATGYAGEELLRILVRHPNVKIKHLVAKIEKSCPINEIFPWLTNILSMDCNHEIDADKISKDCDVIFLALPHRVSQQVTPSFVRQGKRVVDFSADYRIKDVSEYQKWYGVEHSSKDLIKDSVYGLCELYRDKIKTAQLVANPGCYPTGAILGCAAFLKKGLVEPEVIVDAKSGASGAGRTLSVNLLFSEVDENFRAYKVCNHQHMPEITQEMSILAGTKVNLSFIPHLLPVHRGILSTMYLRLKKNMSVFEAVDVCKKFYAHEPFVRVRQADVYPELKDVAHSNFCDIGIKVHEGLLIVITAIDNLVKGAAGQAVQNCNIMFGLDETAGLLP